MWTLRPCWIDASPSWRFGYSSSRALVCGIGWEPLGPLQLGSSCLDISLAQLIRYRPIDCRYPPKFAWASWSAHSPNITPRRISFKIIVWSCEKSWFGWPKSGRTFGGLLSLAHWWTLGRLRSKYLRSLSVSWLICAIDYFKEIFLGGKPSVSTTNPSWWWCYLYRKTQNRWLCSSNQWSQSEIPNKQDECNSLPPALLSPYHNFSPHSKHQSPWLPKPTPSLVFHTPSTQTSPSNNSSTVSSSPHISCSTATTPQWSYPDPSRLRS